MESLGIVIGTAIAVGLGAYFWRAGKPVTPARRILQALVVAVATAAGAAGGHYGMRLLEDSPSGPLAVDRTLEELRQSPLIRLVLAESARIGRHSQRRRSR